MFVNKGLAPLSIVLALLTLPLLTAPVGAEVTWQLRFGAAWLDPDGESTQPLTGGTATTDLDDGFGLTATAEVRFTEHVGLEFGVLATASPDFEVRIADGSDGALVRDELDLLVLGAGFNFHLTPDRPIDLWVGPFVGQAYFSDLLFVVGGDDAVFVVDDELVLGAVVGIDVPISSRWSFTGAARYMAFDIDPENVTGGDAESITLDTLSVSVGIGLRF